MKPIYPIRGVLAYYDPQKANGKGITWREPPHVYFVNMNLGLESLLMFDHKFGVLLAEHWQMAPELRAILLKAPNLTEEERKRWSASNHKFDIAVSGSDVTVAHVMQSLLREAWVGEEPAIQLIEYGEARHAQQEAFGPPRLTVAPSDHGVIVHAKDLWSFIRIAFLLDHANGLTKVCDNPDCPARFFIARRKDQHICQRGECTEWAQRKWSLDYWNREGWKRRKRPQKRKAPKKRR